MSVKHDNNYITSYGDLSAIERNVGDTVPQGEIIAYAGFTGGVSQPQLHFEIRTGYIAID